MTYDTLHWRYTGTSISGDRYSIAILRACPYAPSSPLFYHACESCVYGVELNFHGRRVFVPTPRGDRRDMNATSYNRARDLAEAFLNVCRSWQKVQRVNAWLAADPCNAVIG